ncbi:hypothetical protein [Auraticoccus monumenti]|uniref:Uncharacterized protein n=1 Tax=Auraticoccus monumenti TaxID=675864 RepID=A0A1G7CJE0_9ACTN|nr:hypothetical protein [Auraticoccus monumenti]SDE39514.1 hypothetical protein SAMN04489747_3292 [Auraticoccus monumenti]
MSTTTAPRSQGATRPTRTRPQVRPGRSVQGRPGGVRAPRLAAAAPVSRACHVEVPMVLTPPVSLAAGWQLTARGAAALTVTTGVLMVLALLVMVSRFVAVTA